jgi:small subunit ribosomal protein S8|tara:strand:- start:5193 stop:5579 length:387 start_codon:yes stop_codon:yes gene_type:complete
MKNHLYNMIASIKNGQSAKKAYINQIRKKTCESVLNVLWDEGFISGYKTSKSNPNVLKIFLKYKSKKPVINSIKVLSKPSLRIYYSLKQLWKLDSSKGVIIISTNKGFMSLNDCKQQKLGGEPFIIVK